MEPEDGECDCDVEKEQVCKTCVNELIQRILWTGVPLVEAAHMVDRELWVMELWQ